jgi:hypothetical protein
LFEDGQKDDEGEKSAGIHAVHAAEILDEVGRRGGLR